MLYWLSSFSDGGDLLNLFRYITFRAGAAFFTTVLIGLFMGPWAIAFLRKYQPNGQPIRTDGPDGHLVTKTGTPTMGGVLIVASILFATVLWARLDQIFIWVLIFVTVGFALVGFMDDYRKITANNAKGMSWLVKLGIGVVIATIASVLLSIAHPEELRYMLAFPVFKDMLWPMGIMFVPFVIIVIAGSANAVNLTDGLDGLAIMPVMIAATSLGIIAYAVGRTDFSSYLDVHYVAGSGEILIFVAALVGAGLGFLWYNAPPAAVFMGDTGALALGGALGTISVAIKHELVLAIIGGLFVAEALSVMIQIISFKLTGKRIFLMAPMHHHFEKRGWAESQIVIRFWIIALILALIGLSTLKLR